MMRFTATIAVLFFSTQLVYGQRGAEKCHSSIEDLDNCLDKLERSNEYKTLKNKEKSILQGCLKQNSGTTCMIGSSAGEKCRIDARRDATLKSAKSTMFTAIDNCFTGNVPNPFAVLRMTGDMGVTGKVKGRGGGGKGSSGASAGADASANVIVPDTSDLVPADASGASGTSGSSGSSAAQNCPAPVIDPSTALGGSTTDLTGTSGATDPSSLISSLGGGGLPAGLTGTTPDIGSLLAGGTGTAASGSASGDATSNLLNLFGGGGSTSGSGGISAGRKRRQTDPKTACKPIFDCLKDGKQKLQGDKNLGRSASKLWKEVGRCKAEHSPSLSCIPSTKEQKKCVADARKTYQTALKTFMSTCMSQTNEPNGQ